MQANWLHTQQEVQIKEEAKIFVEKPFMKEAIELRRFDDQAKILNKKTPSLDYFKHYVEEAHNLFLNN